LNWSDARQYIIDSIKRTFPDMREWRDSFNIDNLPSTLLDTHYQITFNNISLLSSNGRINDDAINLTLNIFRNGCHEPVDALDDLLDRALCIRQDAVIPMNVDASGLNGTVQVETVTPFPIDETNDNVIRVELEFVIRNIVNV